MNNIPDENSAIKVSDKVVLSRLIAADDLRFHDEFVSTFPAKDVYTVAQVEGESIAFDQPGTETGMSKLFPVRMFRKTQ